MILLFCQQGRATKARWKPRRNRLWAIVAITFVLAVPIGRTMAQTNEVVPAPAVLKKLTLEELMDLEVTSVSKRAEKLSETASAIQVVTGEDVRRSGATSLPEALRLAPNLQVAQLNSHDWAITARGFNGGPLANNSLANKLLVMIDGRTVYTPLFGGVFWDVQNVMLEDLDRIEVVSGPGGTLWGANAVNGVINVITKSAKDTQGLFLSGGGGSFVQDFGALRYGDRIGSNFFFRVYAQRYDRNSTKQPNGTDATDEWDMTQGGLRADWYVSEADVVTVQGDFYGGNEQTPGAIDTTVDGQNLLTRWTRTFSDESDLSVQLYADRTWRDLHAPSFFSEDLKTYDFDFQHRFPLGERHSILWGAGYRFMQDKINNAAALSFGPADREMQLISGFVQDEIVLVEDRLKFTLGTKLEENEFSGFEVQPSARLAWTPGERHTVWGAVSRAVRSPSRFDTDLTIPLGGDRDFESEKVIAYELGYRVQPTDRISLSLATFYNDYDDLRSINFPPFAFANDQAAETWGVELSGNLQLTSWWRLRGGYTYLEEDIRSTSPAVVPGSAEIEAIDPRHQALLQSIMDLPGHTQLDLVGRYVDDLSGFATAVSDYFTFDARLAWQYKRWEFAVVGQNLGNDEHSEFGSLRIPRSVYGKVTLRW